MKLTFLATFPPIQSAIKIAGNGDGMRVQFDIPESEMGNAVELLAMRNDVLRITVEPDKQIVNRNEKDAEIPKRAKRQSEWKTA